MIIKLHSRYMVLFALFFTLMMSHAHVFGGPSPAEIDKIFSKWNRPDSPGAELAVIQNNQIIYKKAYGQANLKDKIPLKTTHILDIASASKQFTAFCIALLIEQQALSMEDDVHLFFPELPQFDKGKLCLKHLIYHQSGLQDYLDFMDDRTGKTEYDWYSFAEVLNQMKNMPKLAFAPGSQFDYCNTNYLLLSEIIHRVTGKTLRQYANEKIFKPLGMNTTFYHDNLHEIIKDLALGYSGDSAKFKIDVTKLDLVGDGNVYTNVEDFFLWDKNFYKNVLGYGSQELIKFTTTPGVFNNGKRGDYAFGLEVSNYRGLRLISHDGNFVGYASAFVRFPDQHFSVVVFSNLSSIDADDIALQVAELYLDPLMK